MSQYVDMETGEIIDLARFRREQARIEARQRHMRARKSRIYRHVRESDPQTLPTFLRHMPRRTWDRHYTDIMLALLAVLALVGWAWWS
jgi:ferric-dicitrate binding protein FerR (iron transport regulator)